MASTNIPSGKPTTFLEAVMDLCIFIVTIGLLFLLRFQATPAISPATFLAPERQSDVRSLPAFFPSVSDTMIVTFTMDLNVLHPSVFAVQVDDCIEQLAVNGIPVIPEAMPRICSPHELSRLVLGKYLHEGNNTISLQISDIGVTAGLALQPSSTDPLLLTIWLGMMICIVWYALRLRLLVPRGSRWPDLVLVVLLLGIAVRLLYVSVTPYNLRTYDLEGHLDYISFMQQHWEIPIAKNGWEFHQPPLYYALAAGWISLLASLHLPMTLVYQSLAGWSLVISVMTLAVTLFCLTLLFDKGEKRHVGAAGMTLAVFNGFVFFSSRITNETLFTLLAACTVALLLLWWKRGDRMTLIALALVFSLAFLTKVSILAIAPAIAAALLLRRGRVFRRRASDIILASLIVLFAAGWYPVHRLVFEPEQEKTLSLGNNEMNPTLAVQRDFRHMVTLNPVAILRFPFNDPWDDTFRRNYFLEYFFRSAFFGEYMFTRYIIIARILLTCALLLVPVLIVGIVVDVRKRFMALLPLHLTTLGIAAAAVLYPYLFPYASNQDFRFSVLLVLPATYYVVRGIEALPRWLRILWRVIFAAFVFAAFSFIVALWMSA